MRRSLVTPLLLAFLVLAGCGGQADAPATGTMSSAARSVARPQPQAGTPITNEQARAAKRPGVGVGIESGESARVVGDGTPFAIDTGDREQVRLYFARIYQEPTPPIGWTGNRVTGVPGTTSPAFKAATIQRINWFRAMAGLPAAVRLSEETTAKAQHAALIMSAAGQLSHYPPASWKFHTPAGAEAAAASNLTLAYTGPEAIDQYIRDHGANNGPVGHRRWIFHPKTRTIGSGDIPAADGQYLSAANALWVADVDYTASRPRVRDDFVAWPARGFMPYSTVYQRWSLSYPDADFSQARVSVTREGVALNLAVEPLVQGYGENTIVWKMPDIGETDSHARPQGDVRYRVSVSNVLVAQRARSFDYDVTVFDPAVATAGAAVATASAPAQARLGQPYAARIAALPGATGYTLTEFLLAALPASRAAPFDAATWTSANRGGHAILDQGRLRFYVDHDEWGTQSATLNKTLYVAQRAANVLVTRSMGLATATQKFRVQVSTDDGANWQDIYTESGRDQRQALTGVVRAALGAYAGRIVRLRLTMDMDGSAYVGSDTGWTVSEVGFEGIEELTQGRTQHSANGEFMLTPNRAGTHLLLPRAELHGLIDTDPGTPALVSVDGAVLSGARASYTLSRRDGVLTIVDNTGRDRTQTVRDPFRLDFTDLTLAFDVDGNAGQTYRLYRAAFNRKPDSGGIGFWIRGMDGGLAPQEMARAFMASAEFTGMYGAAPTHEQVITALYANVLQRAPDAGGAAFWLGHLANGMPLADVLLAFSESPENKKQVAAEIELGIAYSRQQG